MARALSRSRLNASAVAKSGLGAPSRMQTRDEGLGDVLAGARHRARPPSPACRSPAPTGSPRRRSRRRRAWPAGRPRCRSRTRPHGRCAAANALPSSPTATCIERAHITLSLATPPSVPHTRPGIGQRSTTWKNSASSSRAPTSSWRPVRSIRSWRRWRRWPASRRPTSAAARSAGTRASPRPACRSPR